MKPHRCHILAVDPAATSGWANFRQGPDGLGPDRNLALAGICTTETSTPAEVVRFALEAALLDGCVLVLVGEDWAPYVRVNMNPYWKPWRDALSGEWARQRVLCKPAPKVVRVNVSTWRSKIFARRVDKHSAKVLAVRIANQTFGLDCKYEEHDMAEAICIGYWATYAPEVLAKIPRTFR